jgi:hypothetical protein
MYFLKCFQVLFLSSIKVQLIFKTEPVNSHSKRKIDYSLQKRDITDLICKNSLKSSLNTNS